MQSNALWSVVLRPLSSLPPQIKYYASSQFFASYFDYHGLLELLRALPAFEGNQEQYSPPMSRIF